MWPGFDGKPYTQNEFTAHVDTLPLIPSGHSGNWVKFLTLHNTSAPTLTQWAESGPAHDARIRNLEAYYQQQLGWHAGPHLFVSRSYINGFSDLTQPGVHASCFNHTSIGIEMVGEYNIEEFNSGDGAMVRDNAVHALAVLHRKLSLRPDGYKYGVSGLHFHIECVHDNHDCPGTKARNKPDLVARILARMDQLAGAAPMVAQAPPSPRFPGVALARHKGIVATMFGGDGDSETSAYGGMVDPDQMQVALPARLPSDRRQVRVFRGDNISVVCRANDIGPWNTNDAYWEAADGRPSSEKQRASKTRAQDGHVPTNSAGIDMTPAVFAALGIGRHDPEYGETTIDWEFA